MGSRLARGDKALGYFFDNQPSEGLRGLTLNKKFVHSPGAKYVIKHLDDAEDDFGVHEFTKLSQEKLDKIVLLENHWEDMVIRFWLYFAATSMFADNDAEPSFPTKSQNDIDNVTSLVTRSWRKSCPTSASWL